MRSRHIIGEENRFNVLYFSNKKIWKILSISIQNLERRNKAHIRYYSDKQVPYSVQIADILFTRFIAHTDGVKIAQLPLM